MYRQNEYGDFIVWLWEGPYAKRAAISALAPINYRRSSLLAGCFYLMDKGKYYKSGDTFVVIWLYRFKTTRPAWTERFWSDVKASISDAIKSWAIRTFKIQQPWVRKTQPITGRAYAPSAHCHWDRRYIFDPSGFQSEQTLRLTRHVWPQPSPGKCPMARYIKPPKADALTPIGSIRANLSHNPQNWISA